MELRYLKYSNDLKSVKKQYRELAKIHHPDKPTGSKEAFQRLNEEFEYLKKGGVDTRKEEPKQSKSDVDFIRDFLNKKYTKDELREAKKELEKKIKNNFKGFHSFFLLLVVEGAYQELVEKMKK